MAAICASHLAHSSLGCHRLFSHVHIHREHNAGIHIETYTIFRLLVLVCWLYVRLFCNIDMVEWVTAFIRLGYDDAYGSRPFFLLLVCAKPTFPPFLFDFSLCLLLRLLHLRAARSLFFISLNELRAKPQKPVVAIENKIILLYVLDTTIKRRLKCFYLCDTISYGWIRLVARLRNENQVYVMLINNSNGCAISFSAGGRVSVCVCVKRNECKPFI